MTINFEMEKDTPGTRRFKEVPPVGQPPVIGTIYIKKTNVLSTSDKLVVTIEASK